MKFFLFNTHGNLVPLIARITLGIVMLPHGAQKMLGWFGGNGFSATMGYFTEHMGIPAIFAFLAIFAEFFGALGLIFGFLTRLSAFGVGITMLVALFTHASHGFFMNWSGQQTGEGYEYHLLTIGLALISIIQGAGKTSLDALIAKKLS